MNSLNGVFVAVLVLFGVIMEGQSGVSEMVKTSRSDSSYVVANSPQTINVLPISNKDFHKVKQFYQRLVMHYPLDAVDDSLGDRDLEGDTRFLIKSKDIIFQNANKGYVKMIQPVPSLSSSSDIIYEDINDPKDSDFSGVSLSDGSDEDDNDDHEDEDVGSGGGDDQTNDPTQNPGDLQIMFVPITTNGKPMFPVVHKPRRTKKKCTCTDEKEPMKPFQIMSPVRMDDFGFKPYRNVVHTNRPRRRSFPRNYYTLNRRKW